VSGSDLDNAPGIESLRSFIELYWAAAVLFCLLLVVLIALLVIIRFNVDVRTRKDKLITATRVAEFASIIAVIAVLGSVLFTIDNKINSQTADVQTLQGSVFDLARNIEDAEEDADDANDIAVSTALDIADLRVRISILEASGFPNVSSESPGGSAVADTEEFLVLLETLARQVSALEEQFATLESEAWSWAKMLS